MARFAPMLLAIGVAALSGCPSGASSSGSPLHLEPCDPLAPHELPIELVSVFAAGRDMTGTLYVVDRVSSSVDRIFVSRANTLYRARGGGTGSSGDADFIWQFELDGADERLVVHKEGDKVTGIALAAPGQRTFFDQLDDSAERLTPVDPAALAGFAVRNLPGDVVVEFVADVENGARIVVTRPEDDFSYEDFKLFYGTNRTQLDVQRPEELPRFRFHGRRRDLARDVRIEPLRRRVGAEHRD